MKITTQLASLLLVTLLGVITLLTGCATTSMDRATKTTDSMQTVENDYRQASLQVDAINASLATLTLPNQTDIRKAYAIYDGNVTKMKTLGYRLIKHTGEMQTHRNVFFAEWGSRTALPAARTSAMGGASRCGGSTQKFPKPASA